MAEEKAQRFIEGSDSVEGEAYCANFGAHKPGMSMKEVADYYSSWADKYEEDLNPERYNGPSYACTAVAETYPSGTSDRKAIRILDIACGTGFLGVLLKEEGFSSVDGLDPSDKMLDIARAKDAYGELYCEFMSADILPIDKGTYDCAVIAGGMGEGHIPSAAIDEMIRLVKSGGHVIIVMREEYLTHVKEYAGILEHRIQKLEETGKWTKVSRTVVPKYSFDNNGVIFKYRVC